MKSCVRACFVSGLHAFFFCCITLDYFSNGALNERSVDSNWRLIAAKEYYYYFFLVFFLVFSLDIIFSSFLFS
jgi:hypothetical protein